MMFCFLGLITKNATIAAWKVIVLLNKNIIILWIINYLYIQLFHIFLPLHLTAMYDVKTSVSHINLIVINKWIKYNNCYYIQPGIALVLRTISREITKGISTNCCQANAHHGLFYLKCQFIVVIML